MIPIYHFHAAYLNIWPGERHFKICTVVREDPSTATDLPPHPCAVPIQNDPFATGLTEAKNSRTASTEDEQVFTKKLVEIVRSFLRSHLINMVVPKNTFFVWPPCHNRLCMYSDEARSNLEVTPKWWTGKLIDCWKGKYSKCGPEEKFMCNPCCYGGATWSPH
jgi:hypothetical protein